MKQTLRKWLHLDESQDTLWQSSLRNIYSISLAFSIALIVYIVFLWTTGAYNDSLLFIGAFFLIIVLTFMVRQGVPQLAAWGFPLLAFIIPTIQAYRYSQIFDNALYAYPMVIALAALLTQRRGTIIFTFLTIIATIALGSYQLLGGGRQQAIFTAEIHGLSYIIALILFFVISGIILSTIINDLLNYTKKLQESNAKLALASQNLEERVNERTAQLDRKSSQLEAAALIARSTAETTDIRTLLDSVVEQISSRFGFYHTGIFLSDSTRQKVYLAAASSEGGKRMLQRGHSLDIGRQGVVGYAAYEKRPRVAQDIERENVYFSNPELPDTRSEAALPLLVKNQVIGVLDIQSTEENPFRTEDLFILQTMADQIALAIQNARLLEESQTALEQLQATTKKSIQETWHGYLGEKARGFVYSAGNIIPLDEAGKSDQQDELGKLQINITLRGQSIGKISLARSQTDTEWTEKEQDFTEKIASQIALAVENARLLEESQRRAAREQTLNEMTTRLSRSLDLENLLQNAVIELHKLPQVTDASVVIAPQDMTKQG